MEYPECPDFPQGAPGIGNGSQFLLEIYLIFIRKNIILPVLKIS